MKGLIGHRHTPPTEGLRGSRRLPRRLLKLLPWVAALLLLVWVWRAVPMTNTWQALRQLTPTRILLLAAINLLILAGLNLRWWLILRGQGYALPFLSLFGYRLATFGVSYFTPGPHFGGEPLQVYFVEKKHETPRATAVAAMALDKSLELVVNFAFLFGGLWVILQQQLLGGFERPALLFAFLLLILPLSYLFALWRGRRPLSKLFAVVERIAARSLSERWQLMTSNMVSMAQGSESEAGAFCRRSPFLLLGALLVSILVWALMISEFWLMVNFLGVPLTPVQLVTVLTAARAAILLLLPAGLGALEASQALSFTLLGLNPAVGISASLLIRGRDVLLGAAGLWWGSKRLANK